MQELFTKLELSPTQIKTQNARLTEDWTWKEGERILLGYRAEQEISLNLTGVEAERKAEILLSNLPEYVSLHSSNFGLEDKKNGLKDARALAFKDALEQATQLATLAGKRINRVVNISENTSYQDVYTPRYNQKAFMSDFEEGNRVELHAGEQEQSVSLSVTFQLK